MVLAPSLTERNMRSGVWMYLKGVGLAGCIKAVRIALWRVLSTVRKQG
jgi:hypothetical protein